MRDCAHKQSMCTCIDWKNDDLTMQVNHLMNHFDFTDFELKYTTLEPEENRRLCKVGRCRICHKDLCIGKELPSQAKSDELLTEVYRWMFQMWNPSHDRLSDGADCFSDMFLSVFHESDQEFVSEWLNAPEMYPLLVRRAYKCQSKNTPSRGCSVPAASTTSL